MDAGETFLGQFAVMIGVVAATIAVGGFIGHLHPALTRGGEEEIRRMTAVGGLWGMGISAGVIVLSIIVG